MERKEKKRVIGGIKITLIAMVLAACSENKQVGVGDSWEQLPVVAHTIHVDGQEMLACDFDALKDTLNLPLSFFTEELQLVKLDNRDEALVSMGMPFISENYILVNRWGNVPCKLFRKDGTFVGNVGNVGQGPGEYWLIFDVQIDEENERIYLLPVNAKSLMVYDMTGKYLYGLPLYNKEKDFFVPSGTFRVDAKNNRVGVFSVPFDNMKVLAWVQDMEGNVIHEIPMNHLRLSPDYGNMVFTNKTNGVFDVSLSSHVSRPDTLYHYDMDRNRLLPYFTLDLGTRESSSHDYGELPHHYVCGFYTMGPINEYGNNAYTIAALVVGKKDKKGGFFRLYNDYLGNIPIDGRWFYDRCRNNYYAQNVEPGQLMEDLEKALAENPNMDKAIREKVETLLASMDENDNNYILYAKLK